MKTFWILMAVAAGLAAVYFALQSEYEKAFVASATGAVCWILNYRQTLRESLRNDDEQNQDDEEIHS